MKNKNKKNKKFEEDFEEEEENEDFDEGNVESALEIGGQIHTQSEIIKKNFPHLTKDLKYSKLKTDDINEFIYKSNTYQLWQYVNKCLYISKHELQKIKEDRKKIYSIKTKEDFKFYLENINKVHIWHFFNSLPEEESNLYFEKLLYQLEQLEKESITNHMYSERKLFYTAYDEWMKIRTNSDDIDDLGLFNIMATLMESKKAYEGWAFNTTKTIINVNKEENMEKDTKEETEEKEENGLMRGFKK